MRVSHKIALAGGGVLMLSLIGLILFGQNGYFDYRRLKAQKEALAAENKAAEADNSLLRRRISRLENDKDYIEHIARKELGMIVQDEVVYKFKEQGESP